jgi:hypothetical protein
VAAVTAARPVCKSETVFVTTHVLSGVLVGRATRNRPAAAFVAGVGSHLALDSFPHWGCDKREDGGYDRFLQVAKRDGLLGLAAMGAAIAAVDRRDRVSTVAAIAGAVLLDLDKPYLYFFGRNPFPRWVARIHGRVQNESARGMPMEFVYGALMAMADALVVAGGRRSPSPAAVCSRGDR